jgi:putative DNA methylase
MPASSDPEKDREIFLKLLTMDREGLWRRKSKHIRKHVWQKKY